jgi:hypothetical protein
MFLRFFSKISRFQLQKLTFSLVEMKDQPDNLTENMRKPTRGTEAYMPTVRQQLNSQKKNSCKERRRKGSANISAWK